MSVNSSQSCLLATVCAVLVCSGMQLYKVPLASSQLATLLAGYMGSWVFVLTLTAIGNIERAVFGDKTQVKLFPEVVSSLVLAVVVSGSIHRVCATVCFIFSLLSLWYVNNISTSVYAKEVTKETTKKKQ